MASDTRKCAGKQCASLVSDKPYCSAKCFSGEKMKEVRHMVDLKKVGGWLMQRGLMDKPFSQFSESEIKELVSVIFSSPGPDVPPEGWGKPSLAAQGVLIPYNAHPAYYWWKPEGRSINDILDELNAPEEIRKAYAVEGAPF